MTFNGTTLGITGSITCSADLDIGGDIDMESGKKLTWVDNNQYVSGTATGITVESDDTLQVNADTSVTMRTPSTVIQNTSNVDLMIKSTYTSNGSATLTMISDNGDDLGDGWQIKSLTGSLSFSSDHGTDETYTTEILKLTNSSLQGSRNVLMNSKLEVRESIKMVADKLLYWSDTGTYISGNATTLTIESDDLLVMNADTSATITIH